MPDTDEFSWTMPTVGGSAGTWGTELNSLVDDDIEATVKSVKDTADAALPVAGGTMTGNVQIKTESYSINNKGNISGTVTFDFGVAQTQVATVTGDLTSVTFNNWPSSGEAGFVTLELTNAGAHTITWPSEVNWDGGAEPAFQSNGTDVIMLYSRDGGTTVYAGLSLSVPA